MNAIFKPKDFDSHLERMTYNQDFPTLWQFPKEFKRNWLKQLDTRFIIILSVTFIFEVCTILLLLSSVKGSDSERDVNAIQKRFAHLLLDKFTDDNFSNDAISENTYLYGVLEEISQIENLETNNKQNGSNSYAEKSAMAGSNRDKIFQANTGQLYGDKSSASGGSGSTESGSAIGLLQYLSDDNNASSDELREIFAQGDRNRQRLEGSLANLRLNPYQQQSGTNQYGSGADNAMSYSDLKGSKSNVSDAEVLSSLSPLEKANYSTVAKNTELEESSAAMLNKTGTKASARKAEHVTRVVLDHNRAIQDCYRQALKKQPDIKGKIVVRFSVTPNGSVDLVEVIGSTIEYEPMIKCIVNRIRRWNDFGESDISLGTVSYRQTYVFGY